MTGGAHRAGVALLAVALGCGGGGEVRVAEEDTAAPARAPAIPAKVSTTPAEPDAERGGKLYALYCASCHGPRGDADGPVAASLDPRPARHSDADYMEGLTDDRLFRAIRDGGAAVGKSPLMAAWGGTLDDAQIRDLVAFIRTLSSGRPPPPRGSPGS